jgi:hypothetical protein
MRIKPLPSIASLNEALIYSPQTGDLIWRPRPSMPPVWNSNFSGKAAGSITDRGYRAVVLDNVRFRAHRIIWAMMTGCDPGESQVDHRDGNRSNNRWGNLRLATHGQNLANGKGYSRKGMPKGVSLCGRATYMAQIRIGGSRLYLGSYSTPEEAHEAYVAAAKATWGEFARAC